MGTRDVHATHKNALIGILTSQMLLSSQFTTLPLRAALARTRRYHLLILNRKYVKYNPQRDRRGVSHNIIQYLIT